MLSVRELGRTTWARLRANWKLLLVDAVVLGAAPAVTLVLWSLPLSVREAFTLTFEAPTRVTLLTAHFVHLDRTHYLTNLIGYGLVAGTGYLCFTRARERITFLSAALVTVLLFPIVLSLLSLLVLDTGQGYGLSGIVAGLLGTTVAGIGVYTRRRLPVAGAISPPLFLGGAVAAAVRLLPPELARNGVIIVALLLAGSYLLGISIESPTDCTDGSVLVPIVGIVTCSVVLFAAFPRGALANTASPYIHFIGYGLGYLTVYITLRID